MVSNINQFDFQNTKIFRFFDTLSNLAVFFSSEGKIVHCNLAFCKIIGYEISEIKNYYYQDFLSENYRKLFNTIIKRDLEGEKNWSGELEHQRKDNSKFWVSCSFTKYFKDIFGSDGFLALEEDITLIKELTNRLEYRSNLLFEEKLKIETIINNLPFSILVIETNGMIFYENEIFKTSFKNEFDEEILNNSNIDNYPSNILLQNIKNMMNKNEKQEKIINLKTNVYLQVNTIPMSIINTNSGFIVVIRDITNIIEFDILQKQFVTSVSHELRTPIASILLSVNNYINYREKLSEEQNLNLLQIIQQNANVLKNMVEDLLIVSHIDNKKLKIRNWSKLNLKKVIKQVIMQLKPQFDLKNINLIVDCDENIHIFNDEERLGQIIRIPLENAIKYSFKNQKILITCRNSITGNENSKNKSGTFISIKDNGIGIKSNELKFLFRRYFRGSNVQNIQGSGIGLSILKELISLVNGEITIESAENNGTEVKIFLPMLEKIPN